MSWLNRYFHGVNESPASPSDSRRSLQGVIKAQQKMLGLGDSEYRELLSEITGKNSTTQMDILELERVKYQFNILLSSKP
jgi:phage gp16-like protein